MRLLPQPLYRYESTDPEVIDGAVFSFVTSAGTDPEILLVIEARGTGAGSGPSWQYGLGRFSDLDLWVKHKGKEVYTAPGIPFGHASRMRTIAFGRSSTVRFPPSRSHPLDRRPRAETRP